MATKVLGPYNPDPTVTGKIGIKTDCPFQGQGLNKWKALIRNVSPWPLIANAGVFTFWLGPYEQDYYEFPAGLQSFTLFPQAISLFAGFNVTVVGFVLVTAFDQSSAYDGAFPVALSPPAIEVNTGAAPGKFKASIQLKQTGAPIHYATSVPLLVGTACLADPTNTAKLYVGGSTVSNTSGYLSPGLGLVYPVDDLTDLYTLGTAGDILSVWGF
jgi:hypothetical protein